MAPTATRGQQAAGLSGCRALRDGRDDNVCPLGDWQGTEGVTGKQNEGMAKRRKRQESAEVKGFKLYNVISLYKVIQNVSEDKKGKS